MRATLIEERQLAPEIRPEVRQGAMPVIAEGPKSSTVIEREMIDVVTHQPIIEEVIHKKIIEEIQPVIYREVVAPKIIRETKNIYEKIIEAPVVTYHTLPPRYASGTTASEWTTVQQRPAEFVETKVTTTTIEKDFVPVQSTGLASGLSSSAPVASSGWSSTSAAPLSSSGIAEPVAFSNVGGLGKFEEQQRMQPTAFQRM